MNNEASSLLLPPDEAAAFKARISAMPGVDLNRRQLCSLELILNRAFSPLEGFLDHEDYQSVLKDMRLADGTLWPMPVCLDVPPKLCTTLTPGSELALNDEDGFLLGVLEVQSVWEPDLAREAEAVYGTADPVAHPGVRRFLEETSPCYVGGRVRGINMPRHYDALDLRLTPAEARDRFSRLGWERVVGVNADTALHRAHLESLLVAAREADGKVFLQPAVNQPALVADDHFVRVRCYRAFMRHMPQETGLLGLIPLDARQAGPREALLQALVRRAYGCTHFLVEDHHADPGNHQQGEFFYPRNSAFELIAEHSEEAGIEPVRLTRMAYHAGSESYLPEEQAMGEAETMPEREVCRRLELQLPVPDWFTFPDVLQVLRQAHPPRHKQGFTVFITGLSGAGKSTLAKILYVRFMQAGDRPVTLLDGDIVRKNLSSELSFSHEHRDINIRRIGFVAGQITKNRGIAICAPIAPYEDSRQHNRRLVNRYGGYVEVFLSTPLEVCEQRDVKGLYAKARAGLKKGVTGIDDPYERPTNPDLEFDTSQLSPAETAQRVVLHLRELGYLR